MSRSSLFLCLLSIFLLAPSLPAQDDIIQGEEQEVERFSLGARGMLIFANEVKDVIEGESAARVYLSRQGSDQQKQLIERSNVIVETAWHNDFDGDGLKEVGILWRSFGQSRFGSFEIFEVELDGRLTRVFPKKEMALLPHCEVYLPEDISSVVEKSWRRRKRKRRLRATFAIRHSLCEVSRRSPQLAKTTLFGRMNGKIKVIDEIVKEPTVRHQELNLAAEYFRVGKNKKGLQLARNTLERVRVAGPSELLSDAYLMVARGYRKTGSTALAKVFERRAQLRDDLSRGETR